MNVLIAGGFWASAKFMVLLCGTVILIIKSIYVYQKKYQKWTVCLLYTSMLAFYIIIVDRSVITGNILYAYTALMLLWGVLVLVGLDKRIHYGEKSLQYTEENRRIIIGMVIFLATFVMMYIFS